MKRLSRLIDLLPPAAMLTMLWPAIAHAYVGPSAAVGFGGAAIGLLVAIFSAIGVLLMWPIKLAARFLKRTFGAEAPASTDTADAENAAPLA